ncbi:unnamed protein product [Linum tenue]|uniref:Zinc finger GRF-type domain-containing protein n=1 Tax=Linum tenue TaxID=586396 RepID=A0AAV0PUF4_9ROSI|nr:unnamed protein product [Linum tenue]
MASKGKGQKGIDEFYYEDEEVLCNCGLRASRRISHTVANPNRKFFGCPLFGSKLENADLRAALDRVSKHSVDVGIESKNVISSYEEIVVAIKSIKLR